MTAGVGEKNLKVCSQVIETTKSSLFMAISKNSQVTTMKIIPVCDILDQSNAIWIIPGSKPSMSYIAHCGNDSLAWPYMTNFKMDSKIQVNEQNKSKSSHKSFQLIVKSQVSWVKSWPMTWLEFTSHLLLPWMMVITHTHLALYPEVWVTRIQSVSNELVLLEDQLKIAPEVKMSLTWCEMQYL